MMNPMQISFDIKSFSTLMILVLCSFPISIIQSQSIRYVKKDAAGLNDNGLIFLQLITLNKSIKPLVNRNKANFK